MGAIAGIYCRHQTAQPDAVATLKKMLPGSAGEPAQAIWGDASIGLQAAPNAAPSASEIHRLRLDRSQHSLAITADVRLDNRAELSALLDLPTSERPAVADELLILLAYLKWGSDCPEHLLGDFAFAIWDPVQQRVFCARDHVGAKRFYYFLAEELFAFGSDLAELVRRINIPSALHGDYVAAHLLVDNFEHPELTFLDSIRKLPPAHTLIVGTNTSRKRRYWNPADAPDVRLVRDDDYVDAFVEIFQDAVHARLRGAASIGAHVTGGLDSSSIAVLAARQLREQAQSLTCYCWEPPPSDLAPPIDGAEDERRLIAAVCQQEALPLRYQSLTSEDLVAVLKRDVRVQPTVDTLVHEQLVQRQAEADGVDVILSGWGGDELIGFNGRGYLPELLLQGRWRHLYQISKQRSPRVWRFLFRQALLPIAPAWLRDNYDRLKSRSRGVPATAFLNSSCLPEIRAAAARLTSDRTWSGVGIRRMQLQLMELGHLTQRMESWASSGAKHRLEYRYPLLDKRIIEFALGLPAEQFVNGPWTRYLMRNAVAGLVPQEVQWHRDKSDPVRSEILRDVTPDAYKQVAAQLAEQSDEIDGSQYVDVRRLVKRLNSAEPIVGDESRRVWHMLQFLNF